MTMKVTDSLVGLDPDLAISLQRQHDLTTRNVELHLWLAQEGLADDVLLSSGDRTPHTTRKPLPGLSAIRRRGAELIAWLTRTRHKAGAA